MKKKKFDLTADIVEVEGGEHEVKMATHATRQMEQHNKIDKHLQKEVITVLMGIQVEEDVRADYKSWCARHKMKMNEAFLKGFKLLKEKYGR